MKGAPENIRVSDRQVSLWGWLEVALCGFFEEGGRGCVNGNLVLGPTLRSWRRPSEFWYWLPLLEPCDLSALEWNRIVTLQHFPCGSGKEGGRVGNELFLNQGCVPIKESGGSIRLVTTMALPSPFFPFLRHPLSTLVPLCLGDIKPSFLHTQTLTSHHHYITGS